jgi:hypothetical protein
MQQSEQHTSSIEALRFNHFSDMTDKLLNHTRKIFLDITTTFGPKTPSLTKVTKVDEDRSD